MNRAQVAKLVHFPSTAAILKEKEQFYRKTVGVILSGGNADLDRIPFLSSRSS
jgi:threonine dehydratase